MNYLYSILIFITIFFHVDGGFFDRYSGNNVEHVNKINKECLVEVRPCTPHEGTRIDGTCNNYKRPSRGSARGPYLRLLKPDYGDYGSLRRGKSGHPLPSARKVRTMLQSTGRVVDKVHFNGAAGAMIEFVTRDISILNGPLDYLRNRLYCCEPKGEEDPRCAPIHVPRDDPYLRVTDIHCLNFSRAETFRDSGCIAKDMDPEQVNLQTPVLDLSTIYGVDEEALKGVRKYELGLLKIEKRGERHVPLREHRDICFQNRDKDGICYKFGFSEVGNIDLRTTTLNIFFVHHHNRIARLLHEINPCWADDRLFKVARQINIGTAANIFLYELLPQLMGHKYMLQYGLISDHVEYVTAYDEDAEPLVYAEFEIARRFFRTLLDGRLKKYSENHQYVGELSASDTLFRQELIEKDSNFEELNRGTFYQNSAKIDDIQDPEISEKYYGEIMKAADLPAADIQRGRDVGLQGYNAYRKMCGLKTAKHFEDLLDVMGIEKMEALKKLYEDIEDIDLLAGLMSETLLPGAFVGPTLFCIMAKQVHTLRFADRFWFERGEQYHSLTPAQLNEIRKTNMARFACDNAEGIKFIQPHAFLNVGHSNMPVPCSHIQGPDLNKWYDETCHRQQHTDKEYFSPGPNFNHNLFLKEGFGYQQSYAKEAERQPESLTKDDGQKYDTDLRHHEHTTKEKPEVIAKERNYFQVGTHSNLGQSYAYNKLFDTFPGFENRPHIIVGVSNGNLFNPALTEGHKN